ncbi:MAG: hypothetical protein LBU32_05075 [Clostridiales bacterium]|jgi:hypothetical protein|nr:hypothetical protein [Clostridiales bacterium]
MLSIQGGGLCSPLADYAGKAAEFLPEEEFLEHPRMKAADSARNRRRLPFDQPARISLFPASRDCATWRQKAGRSFIALLFVEF